MPLIWPPVRQGATTRGEAHPEDSLQRVHEAHPAAPGYEPVAVFIINEIDRYKMSMPAENIRDVMRRLTRLVNGTNYTLFKLLATSQGRAQWVGEFFKGRTLDVDGEVDWYNWVESAKEVAWDTGPA